MMRLTYLLLIVYVSAYEYGHYLEEGAICKKRTGEIGKCTHYSKCESAIKEVRRNGRPEICSFDGIYPIVCCNDGYNVRYNNTPTEVKGDIYIPFDENSVSLKKCREYHPKIPSDIHYGEKISNINRYPHMALLGFEHNNRLQWKCAGSLISEEYVLTAADCLHPRFGRLKHVSLGELDITSPSGDVEPQDFDIKSVHVHPRFKNIYYDNIALLQLNKPAKFASNVKPACLPVTQDLNGILLESVGWSLSQASEPGPQVLEAKYLKYVTNNDCSKIYGTSKFLHLGIDNKYHICAGGNAANRDICHNDPGGPLQTTNFVYGFSNFPEIMGISSFGKDCRNSPDVFTKVYPYVSWIEKIVWPNL